MKKCDRQKKSCNKLKNRLVQSALKNEYLSEKDYELSDWYPQLCRKRSPLIPSSTRIHVASAASGVDMVKQMVSLTGATMVASIDEADIVISDTSITDKIVVKDVWLFDSIEQWQCNVYLFLAKKYTCTDSLL